MHMSSEERMKHFNSDIAIVLIYEKQWFESNAQLTAEFERLKLWRSAYDASIPTTVLVEKAEVPIVKSRPKRSILVVTAAVIAFIFSIFAVLLLEVYQENWKTALDGNRNNNRSFVLKKRKNQAEEIE